VNTLRIFIPNNWLESAGACAWVLFEGDTSIIGPAPILREGIDTLNAMPLAQNFEIVIAPELVSFIRATLPAGNRKRVLEALPYLVEDSLMASPELVHVVIAEMLSSTEAMLATIDKRVLTGILDKLQAASITPQRLYPATLLPALPTFGWALVLDGANCFLRTSHCSGIPLEIEDITTPPLALQLAVNQAREKGLLPDSIYVYDNSPIRLDALPSLDSWQNKLGVPCVANHTPWKNTVGPAAMNFLQGSFAPQNMGWSRLAQAKPAAMFAACIIAIQLSGICIDWAVKSHQSSTLSKEMTSLFLATFPDTTAIVDAPLQMQRKYAEMQHAAGNADASDFLPLLANAASLLGNLPGNSIRAVDYESGKLVLSLHAASNQAAQDLLTRANSKALNASLDHLQSSSAGVDFQLSLSSSGVM